MTSSTPAVPTPACITVGPAGPVVRLPFAHVPGYRQADWDRAAADLWADGGPAPFGPPRTTLTPLAAWLVDQEATMAALAADPVRAALRAGIAFDDLLRLAHAGFTERGAAPSIVAGQAATEILSVLAPADPGMPLRDAVGWLLWAYLQGCLLAPQIEQALRPWVRAGLGRDGWGLASAGLTVAEAAAAVADGRMDRDQAMVLAALRGAPLPV